MHGSAGEAYLYGALRKFDAGSRARDRGPEGSVELRPVQRCLLHAFQASAGNQPYTGTGIVTKLARLLPSLFLLRLAVSPRASQVVDRKLGR